MAEDKKKRLGLHKKISSIFEGVPLPQPGDIQPPPPPSGESPAEGAGERGGIPQKPLPPPFQTLRASQASRPYEASRPLPQAAVSQPKADTAKAGGLISMWQKIKDKLLAPKPGVSGTRQKVMLVLVPVLFIVLIFVAISVMVPPQKARIPPQGSLATAAGSDTKIDWEIPPPYPATLRDPMQPAPSAIIPGKTRPGTKEAEAAKSAGRLIVKGILYSDDKPSAIIGTQIVHEGDKIYGVTVVKINKDSVEFEIEGKKEKKGVEP
jgi:hypothetical protein